MKFYTSSDMKNMPPPEWIFHEVLQKNSTALLFGPSAAGKSFVALEMAFALEMQHSGVFKPKEQGAIIYVAGEGVSALGVRISAWEHARDLILPERGNIRFLGRAVQVADPKERRLFVTAIKKEFKAVPVLLIVFDTLARCAVGLDENSARDMGTLVDGIEQIREELKCTILLVHHSTKARPDTERGSGAVFAAVDTVLSLKEKNKVMELECRKQKNSGPADARRLKLKRYNGSCAISTEEVKAAEVKVDTLAAVKQEEGAKKIRLLKRVCARDDFISSSAD